MFHFDRKLQQEKVDTSSGDNPSSDRSTPPDGNASPDNERHTVSAHKVPDISDKTADINSRIEVITSAEDEEDAEAREAYESLMRHRKIRLRKKFIKVGIALGVVVLIGIAFVARLFESDKQVEAPTASTAFITRGEFSDSVSASGSIKPISSTVVTPEVDGIIQDVQVTEGSVVKKGDKLFTIKNDELDKAVRKAAQQVKAAENEVSKAKAALAAARSGAVGVGEDDQENGGANAPSVEASVETAQANLESAQIALEEARSAHNDAVAQADKRTVTAPCDGTVIVMNAVNGASVGYSGGAGAGSNSGSGASGSLITIADLSKMKVNVQINEVDISRIAVDQKAQVTFAALRELSCEATVTHVSTVSSSGGDTSGMSYDGRGHAIVTYDVELLIETPDASIKPGMTASADIMIQHMENVLTVPLFALAEDETGTYVNVVTSRDDKNNPQVKRVPVTVKAKSSTTAVIEGEGINDGTEVLLAGGTGNPDVGILDNPDGGEKDGSSGSASDTSNGSNSSSSDSSSDKDVAGGGR